MENILSLSYRWGNGDWEVKKKTHKKRWSRWAAGNQDFYLYVSATCSTPVNKLQYCPLCRSPFLGHMVTQTRSLQCFFWYHKEKARSFMSPGSWSYLLLQAPVSPFVLSSAICMVPVISGYPTSQYSFKPVSQSSSSNCYESLYLLPTAIPQDTTLYLPTWTSFQHRQSGSPVWALVPTSSAFPVGEWSQILVSFASSDGYP